MKKLTKKDLKKINGGYIDEPGEDGRCRPGWFYVLPTSVLMTMAEKSHSSGKHYCFG
jgi:bacteriocin-like protein